LTGQLTNFPLGLLADSFPFFWKEHVAGSINGQTVAVIQHIVYVEADCVILDDTVADSYIWQACLTWMFFHTEIPDVLCLASLNKEQEWIYNFTPVRETVATW